MLYKLKPALCALLLGPALALAEVPADLVIWNGTIYTANPGQQVVDAIAVRGDRIAYVGDRDGAARLVGEGTEVVDLKGRMALPGLHDVHIHPVLALERMTCELPAQNAFTLEELVSTLRSCLAELGAAAPAAGGWITVSQFNGYNADTPRFLGKYASVRAGLDAVSDRHCVFLSGADGHVYGVNSYALSNCATLNGKPVAINAATLGAELSAYLEYYQLDDRGEPSGIVKDAGAYDLFDYAKESVDSLVARADEFNRYFHRYGITSAQDAWADERAVGMLAGIADAGKLQVRMSMALKVSRDQYIDAQGKLRLDAMLADFTRTRARFEDVPNLRAEGVKLMVDGVIEYPTQTAALKHHYLAATWDAQGKVSYTLGRDACPPEDSPCAGEQFNYGILEFKPDDLRRAVIALDKAGFTLHFHALGDRAVAVTLDAVEAAREANPGSTLPHNLAHLQQVDPADVPRFGRAGLFIAPTLSWNAAWVDYDQSVIPFIDEHRNVNDLAELYDQDREYMRRLYPVRSLMAAGAVVSAGSDAPVDGPLPRPFTDIMYGLLRGNWVEVPGSDGERYWAELNSSERLRIEDLLDAYTINGARALGQAALTGSLEVGKKADIAIISQDIIAAARTLETLPEGAVVTEAAYSICDPWWGEHCRTRVEATYFDGRRVYSAADD